MRLIWLFVLSTISCAPSPTIEAPRALPSALASVSIERFRGVPVESIVGVMVDGHAIDRARIEERAAVIPRAGIAKAIDALVDDALLSEAAERLHVVVSSDELERAKKNKLNELGLNDAEWAAELTRQGITEEALMRQWREAFLRAKVSQLVLGPIDVGEGDERAAYAAFVHRESFDLDVDMLVVDAVDEKLAVSVVARARGGEDFCKLVASYSVDAMKAECGSRGPMHPSSFVPEVSQSLAKMRDRDVSDPVRISNKLVVLRLRRRLIPAFEEVYARMHELALEEREAHLYAAWLDEQRAHARIEVLSSHRAAGADP